MSHVNLKKNHHEKDDNNDNNNDDNNDDNNDNNNDNNDSISLTVEEIDEETSSKSSDSSESCSVELKEKINLLVNSAEKNYKKFAKYNQIIIKKEENDEMKMNINYEKDFKEHLQKKLNKLDNRLNILQMKYNNYKKWYDRFNIMIIMISSMLSIYEAFKLELIDLIDQQEEELLMFLNLVPIVISSTITCSAAIIKFKKYQEKMENMQFTREKVILAISKIKHVQESLWFSSDEDFRNIKKKYLDDVYLIYNESNSELERHIKFNDHHKFYKMYQKRPKEKEKKKSIF